MIKGLGNKTHEERLTRCCLCCLQPREWVQTWEKTFNLRIAIVSKLPHMLTQVRVPDTQWGQTNWKVRVWSRERFITRPCKETGGSWPKSPELPEGFWQSTFFFFFFLILFIYFWLCWVFVSVRGLSLVAASGSHSSSRCASLSLSWPLLLRSTGSRRAGSVVVAHGLSCSAAYGNLPRPGLEPMSPALAGRFSTTAPPGKPRQSTFKSQVT